MAEFEMKKKKRIKLNFLDDMKIISLDVFEINDIEFHF